MDNGERSEAASGVPEDRLEGTESETTNQTGADRIRAGLGAFGSGIRRVGRAVGERTRRIWGGVTARREQKAEARMEAAREAAKARAVEVAGVPLKASKDVRIDTPVKDSTPTAGKDEEVKDVKDADEPEELGKDGEVKDVKEVDEPKEPEAVSRHEDDVPITVTESRLAKAGVWLAGATRRGVGAVRTGCVRAGVFLGATSRATATKGAAVGRAIWARSRRAGQVVWARSRRAGQVVWAGLGRAGQVVWAGLQIGGRAFLWMGRAALAGLSGISAVAWGACRRWVERIRKAWVAHPPRPRTLTLIGASLVIVIGYVLAQASVASRVAPGTSILGIDVGGLSGQEAQGLIEGRLEDLSSSTVSLHVHGGVVVLEPEELGLGIDFSSTYDSLTGYSWSPLALWRQVAGTGAVEPVVTVDEDQFQEAVAKAVSALEQDSRNAEVVLGPNGATVRASQDTVTVDSDVVAETLLRSWPSDSTIDIYAEVAEPALPTSEARRFAQAINGIVLGSPVTLSSPNGSVVFTPEDLAAYGSITVEDSGYSYAVDGEALADLVFERLPGVENSAVNASFTFNTQHQLNIKPGAPARILDIDSLDTAVASVAMGVSRVGEIPLIETDPEVTTADLENSDYQELIATYFTAFTPREPSREHNIANAADKLVGRVVKPGEEFSITDAIGPITRSNGYVGAGVVVGGVHAIGIGGGLCQVSTTSYVAAYLAGYEILERSPHSEWFSRYPAGRDAAIAEGTDMRFRNDTPYAMMFNAYLDGAGLRVDIWSTPYYAVERSDSGKYNYTGGGYRISTETPCHQSYPKSGFTISDTRKVYLDGELVKNETRVSIYRAVSGTRCE